jgi:23S rRNA (guanosine2251-2'-O)-methyltransferase
MATLKLTNPHSVLAALKARPVDVLEVHASPSRGNETWKEVIAVARSQGISVREPAPAKPARKSDDGGRIGTTYALVREKPGLPLEELYAHREGEHGSRGLWLALDQLQDPHNVGAVFRTAAFFGVRGIIITQNRSAPLSATVYDIASGGIEHVPFTLQTNLARAIDLAKKSDLWVLGSTEHAPRDVAGVDRDRNWLLVVGNEEKGLRRLTLEKCDELCRIPPRGPVTSLNVSVATGILVATLCR